VNTPTCPSCRSRSDVSVIDQGDHAKGVCDRCLFEWPIQTGSGAALHPAGPMRDPDVSDASGSNGVAASASEPYGAWDYIGSAIAAVIIFVIVFLGIAAVLVLGALIRWIVRG
jgi:hypothetical protein